MSTYKSFRTSDKKCQDGVIMDMGEAGAFHVLRAFPGNAAYRRAMERETRALRAAADSGTLGEAESVSILASVYSRTIVLKWEDVTGEDGQPLPFSPENCEKILKDLPDLFSKIREFCEDYRNFLASDGLEGSDASKSG
jgi:hypothetical protein